MAKQTRTNEPDNPMPERRAGAPRKRGPRKSVATLGDETAAAARDIRVSEEELHRLVSEAAYYKAQQRGFAPGYEHQDWLDAEAEVRQRLGVGKP